MLIAQLLFFYPGWPGIVQIPCDMSFKLNIWKTLWEGGNKIFLYMHFLSMLCHFKYNIVRKKGILSLWYSFGKVEESSLSFREFLYCFKPLVFSSCQILCVTRTLCSPSGYWAQVGVWKINPKTVPKLSVFWDCFLIFPQSQKTVCLVRVSTGTTFIVFIVDVVQLIAMNQDISWCGDSWKSVRALIY